MQSADPDAAYLNVYDYDVSLLPLMAYIKFYLDWIVPSRYINQYASLRNFVDTFVAGSNSALAFSAADLALLFSIDFASYLDNDYFTSAWKYPAAPEDESFQTFSVPDVVFDTEKFLMLRLVKI